MSCAFRRGAEVAESEGSKDCRGNDDETGGGPGVGERRRVEGQRKNNEAVLAAGCRRQQAVSEKRRERCGGTVVGDSKERDDANWSHEDGRQWLLGVCNGIWVARQSVCEMQWLGAEDDLSRLGSVGRRRGLKRWERVTDFLR